MSADESYTGLVRLADAAFPRRSVVALLVWLAILGAIEYSVLTRISPVFRVVIAVWLIAMFALFWYTYGRNGMKAFSADASGIRLGAGARKDRQVQLTWAEVQQLSVSPMSGGALVEVVLSPGTAVSFRSTARQLADVAIIICLSTYGSRYCTPALLIPRRDPLRYRVPLVKTTPGEVQAGLAAIGPEVTSRLGG
jgi:hypothetical protein